MNRRKIYHFDVLKGPLPFYNLYLWFYHGLLQSVRIGHLDCPHSDWPSSVTSVPANAMRLNCHGRIAVGLKADFVLFSARKYSELLSRPQHDRVNHFLLVAMYGTFFNSQD